jgi:hypothetical protein
VFLVRARPCCPLRQSCFPRSLKRFAATSVEIRCGKYSSVLSVITAPRLSKSSAWL